MTTSGHPAALPMLGIDEERMAVFVREQINARLGRFKHCPLNDESKAQMSAVIAQSLRNMQDCGEMPENFYRFAPKPSEEDTARIRAACEGLGLV